MTNLRQQALIGCYSTLSTKAVTFNFVSRLGVLLSTTMPQAEFAYYSSRK